MRGEFIDVWIEAWREIWLPLTEQTVAEVNEALPEDIFCELYRAVAPTLSPSPSIEVLAGIIASPVHSREAFERISSNDLTDEPALVGFFEEAHDVLDELGDKELTDRYFNLLSGFIYKFNLRYDLCRPCTLCPTLPGVFSSLVSDLHAVTNRDPHLKTLMNDFEGAVRDLRHGGSDRRIKTCIQKQVNLLEGIGRTAPGVSGNTLGVICDQIGTWPHEKLKEAMHNLYVFASDYPGIRHGGTPESALRTVDMRDLVAMSILLTGFTPYLERRLNADSIFGGIDESVHLS